MTLPRSILIDPDRTSYYHCVSRCVRRAFLCGRDQVSGHDFEHRRAWIEARLLQQAAIFAIDVCAYAVMANHYHVVLRIDTEKQKRLSDAEVVARWARLYRVPKWFDEADKETVTETIAVWRTRLGSISWFMKCVNERLARMANKEDGCKGRFWEGRFKSQALLDDPAVLRCMAYVDLNPIRAGIASTPESSAYTSVQARILDRGSALMPMADEGVAEPKLPISKRDYLALVDWTGRQVRPDKPGRIAAARPPIIDRLQQGMRRPWVEEMRHLSRLYFRAIGDVISLDDYREYLGQLRLKGLTR